MTWFFAVLAGRAVPCERVHDPFKREVACVLATAGFGAAAGAGREERGSVRRLFRILIDGGADVHRHIVLAIDVFGFFPFPDALNFRRWNREAVVGNTFHGVRVILAKVAAAIVDAVLVVAKLQGGIVVRTRSSLQAGHVHAMP